MDQQPDVGSAGEDGAVLCLQGVSDILGTVDDRARGREGVRPEGPLRPPHDLRNPREDRTARRRLPRVHGRVHGQPAGRPRTPHLVPADGDGGQMLAIGSPTRHRYVVRLPFVSSPAGSPLDTARSPFGTVTARLYVALSHGWWLPGNHA